MTSWPIARMLSYSFMRTAPACRVTCADARRTHCSAWNRSASTSTHRPAATPSRSATASSIACRACSTRPARRRAASSSRARRSGGFTGSGSPRLGLDRADPRARRRALQAAADGLARLRRADPRERRSRLDARSRSAAASSATWPASPRPRYLRGIALVHVPTTLLAQVDSAIGGKVGVNHALGKNLIGAFYQPHAVVIDPSVLGTLPRREFRAGLYEVIKYGMTSSPTLVRADRRATARRSSPASPTCCSAVIGESCRIKATIVAADEREAGPRRILNFGHTAGHALEAVTKYRRYRHGEAVAYGMLVAAELAVARGALAERDRQALADLIASLGPLPPIADVADAADAGGDAARQEDGRRPAALRAADGDRRDGDRRRCDREGAEDGAASASASGNEPRLARAGTPAACRRSVL